MTAKERLSHAKLSAKEKARRFKKEFRNQTITAIIAAFGFLIALSWRDFISETVNKIVASIGVSNQLYLYKLLSAVFITILAIMGIMISSKFQVKEESEENSK